MFRKVGVPLLVGVSLFWVAACAPVPLVTPELPDAVAADAPESAPPAAPAESVAAPVEAGGTITAVQPLDWGATDENCILPGLVITGTQGNAVPCEPVLNEEEPMPQDTLPEEPAQPHAQDAYAAEMTAVAVDDLAQRLGIPADQIEVVEVSAMTWPDASLGCPQPDMMYAQVLTEGMLIRLSAGGETFAYHSGGNQTPFLCENTD